MARQTLASLEKYVKNQQVELEKLKIEFEEEKEESLYDLRQREYQISRMETYWNYWLSNNYGPCTMSWADASQEGLGTKPTQNKPRDASASGSTNSEVHQGLETKPEQETSQAEQSREQKFEKTAEEEGNQQGLETKPEQETSQAEQSREQKFEKTGEKEGKQQRLETKPEQETSQAEQSREQKFAKTAEEEGNQQRLETKPVCQARFVPPDEYIKNGKCMLSNVTHSDQHAMTPKHVRRMWDFTEKYWARQA